MLTTSIQQNDISIKYANWKQILCNDQQKYNHNQRNDCNNEKQLKIIS